MMLLMLLLLYHICNIFSRVVANRFMISMCNHRDLLLPQISVVSTCFHSQLTKMVCLFRIGRNLLPLCEERDWCIIICWLELMRDTLWNDVSAHTNLSTHSTVLRTRRKWNGRIMKRNTLPDCYSRSLSLPLSLSFFNSTNDWYSTSDSRQQ